MSVLNFTLFLLAIYCLVLLIVAILVLGKDVLRIWYAKTYVRVIFWPITILVVTFFFFIISVFILGVFLSDD